MYDVMASVNTTVHAMSCGVRHRLGYAILSAIEHEIGIGTVRETSRALVYKIRYVMAQQMLCVATQLEISSEMAQLKAHASDLSVLSSSASTVE
jgi:hypothetical protein